MVGVYHADSSMGTRIDPSVAAASGRDSDRTAHVAVITACPIPGNARIRNTLSSLPHATCDKLGLRLTQQFRVQSQLIAYIEH
jgi:hypothetical protein